MAKDDEPMLTLQVRLPRQMIDRLDKFRFGMVIRLTRAQTIRYFLETGLTLMESDNGDKSA